MAKLGRPRKKRPYHFKNKTAHVAIIEGTAITNGALVEAHALCVSVKQKIAGASPEARRIAIRDLLTDLGIMDELTAR